MTIICPTVLASNSHQFREQIERVEGFASRIHLDFMDGDFAPTKSISLSKAWLPDKLQVDLHIMHKNPFACFEDIVRLKPSLVIVHAEADGNFVVLAQKLHDSGIKAGIAILAETEVEVVKPALQHLDHLLVFSGDLGHFGGKADMNLLNKVKKAKSLKPSLEIGWDGGVNDTNVAQLAQAGVDVINVGGYVQRAENPHERYNVLKNLIHK